ncbi:MAG: hypothetical protein D6727_00040 [Gammaproteobacteria bacterium]|nr:MAG: hypothetical protein D6727_00040 [Gammaproteobacteria bacterium]
MCVAVAAALFSQAGSAALVSYSENFEGLNAADPGALGAAGWRIFGNVFTGGGLFKFGYGVFAAPNGGPGFSAIASGEGGPAQGNQYINIYSDYNCCGAGTTNEGHFNGTDLVESNVFQEFTIDGTADAGLWTFTFDVKAPSSNGCDAPAAGTPQATCMAFIKTLNPAAGFATTNFITFDSSNVSNAAWSTHSLQINVDGTLAGQLLQIGFTSTSSNFQNTGVYYDNLVFSNVVPVPAAAWLFASALGLLAGVRRRLAS